MHLTLTTLCAVLVTSTATTTLAQPLPNGRNIRRRGHLQPRGNPASPQPPPSDSNPPSPPSSPLHPELDPKSKKADFDATHDVEREDDQDTYQKYIECLEGYIQTVAPATWTYDSMLTDDDPPLQPPPPPPWKEHEWQCWWNHPIPLADRLMSMEAAQEEGLWGPMNYGGWWDFVAFSRKTADPAQRKKVAVAGTENGRGRLNHLMQQTRFHIQHAKMPPAREMMQQVGDAWKTHNPLRLGTIGAAARTLGTPRTVVRRTPSMEDVRGPR